MGHGFSIQSAAGSHALFQWNTRQATHPQGRSGGVSYSHFAETHHVTTCGMNTVYALRSTLQTQIHFLGCHGIFVKEITCTATDFHINDAFFVGQVVIHTCIDNFQAESVLAAQKVDTGPSMQEVTDLLPGNLLRRSTDLLFHNAVVGCKKQVIRIVQRRRQGLLNHTNLQGQFLQTPQRTFRFRQVINLFTGCLLQFRTGNRCYSKLTHDYPFTLTGIPHTISTT